MNNNWLSLSIKDLKKIKSSEILDYQLVFVEEWGDFAFYHPNYLPIYDYYDYYSTIKDKINYNLTENYCITPPNKNYEQPGRWLKKGDITINLIAGKSDGSSSGVSYYCNVPRIIPYKIGQRCNFIIRDYYYNDEDFLESNQKGYPVAEMNLMWESINIPENSSSINPNIEPRRYGLTWWLTSAKPVISFHNPKVSFDYNDYNKLAGLIWFIFDENRFFINSTNYIDDYYVWYEINTTEAI